MNTTATVFAVLLASEVLLPACSAAPSQPESTTQASAPARTPVPRRTLTDSDRSVLRYFVDGKTYYFVQSPCCDMHNYLYDEQGNYVCAPSGGFTGAGDGRCPELRQKLRQSTGVQVPNPFYKP